MISIIFLGPLSPPPTPPLLSLAILSIFPRDSVRSLISSTIYIYTFLTLYIYIYIHLFRIINKTNRRVSHFVFSLATPPPFPPPTTYPHTRYKLEDKYKTVSLYGKGDEAKGCPFGVCQCEGAIVTPPTPNPVARVARVLSRFTRHFGRVTRGRGGVFPDNEERALWNVKMSFSFILDPHHWVPPTPTSDSDNPIFCAQAKHKQR